MLEFYAQEKIATSEKVAFGIPFKSKITSWFARKPNVAAESAYGNFVKDLTEQAVKGGAGKPGSVISHQELMNMAHNMSANHADYGVAKNLLHERGILTHNRRIGGSTTNLDNIRKAVLEKNYVEPKARNRQEMLNEVKTYGKWLAGGAALGVGIPVATNIYKNTHGG